MEILETNNQDIRWKQRFQNYEKAFHRLSRAIEIVRITPDDNLLQSGLQALADRNLTVHIYDDEIIVRVLRDIYERYFFILQEFYTNFKVRADE